MLTCTQDEGAPSALNTDCANTTHPVFAIYPASSPYITAISGTTVTPLQAVEQVERGVEQDNSPICQNPGFTCVTGPVIEWPCMRNNTYVFVLIVVINF